MHEADQPARTGQAGQVRTGAVIAAFPASSFVASSYILLRTLPTLGCITSASLFRVASLLTCTRYWVIVICLCFLFASLSCRSSAATSIGLTLQATYTTDERYHALCRVRNPCCSATTQERLPFFLTPLTLCPREEYCIGPHIAGRCKFIQNAIL